MSSVGQDVVVEVLLRAGKRMAVPATDLVGAYAVHPRIVQYKPVGPGWAITHRASGLMVWSVALREDAVRVAAWLTENKALPEDAAALEKWRETVRAGEVDRLALLLTALAPRYNPPA